MTDRAERLRGRVGLAQYGEADDVLCVMTPAGRLEFVAAWAEQFNDCEISLRYWTADREVCDDELKRAATEAVLGRVDASLQARYSDITGYLWTDEDFNVGGHDMMRRLKSEVGRWLLLEVEVSHGRRGPR